jgi:Ser/Thr protein kinase RdoA (MazF antagonist)
MRISSCSSLHCKGRHGSAYHENMEHAPRIDRDEIIDALARFGVTHVQAITRLRRGGVGAPKFVIDSECGRLLLKRRPARPDSRRRLEIAHELADHLRAGGLSVPPAIRSLGGAPFLIHENGFVYELSQFVEGRTFDESLEQAGLAGLTLARFHRAVEDFQPPHPLPKSTYHNTPRVRTALNQIPSQVSGHESVVGHEAELLGMIQELHERYDDAAAEVEAAGFSLWVETTNHGDWHPGNLLLPVPSPAAPTQKAKVDQRPTVIDLDSVRQLPPIVDLAYGMLQFGLVRAPGGPEHWPEFLDEGLMRRFFTTYQTRVRVPIEQRMCIPALMVEALVAEPSLPIATTGLFGQRTGYSVLRIVRSKIRWLLANREHFKNWLRD